MMRRECLTALVALLVGGVTAVHADLRGETVCGVPPTEPVVVLFSVSWAGEPAERWACGPSGCDQYQGAPEVGDDEYVCDVLVEPSDRIYVGRLFRLGPLGYPPLDPNEEIDPDIGPSDARYYVDDVLSGGGSAAPPGDRCVYIGDGDLLESPRAGRRRISRMLREAETEETERLFASLQKVREVSDANLGAAVSLLYGASRCLHYYWEDDWDFVQKVGRETARVLNLIMGMDDPSSYYVTSDPLGLLLGGDREERFMKIILPALDPNRRDEFERDVEIYKRVQLYGNG